MSNRPWMPFYPGDYLQDTGHLSLAEHGAYMLLIMHYWSHGGLPDDPGQLKRILGLPSQSGENQWRSICQALAPFFEQPGWRHKRIDAELQRYNTIREKRQMAGRIGGLRAHNKSGMARIINEASAKQTGYQPQRESTTSSDSLSRPTERPTRAAAFAPSDNLESLVRAKGWT